MNRRAFITGFVLGGVVASLYWASFGMRDAYKHVATIACQQQGFADGRFNWVTVECLPWGKLK